MNAYINQRIVIRQASAIGELIKRFKDLFKKSAFCQSYGCKAVKAQTQLCENICSLPDTNTRPQRTLVQCDHMIIMRSALGDVQLHIDLLCTKYRFKKSQPPKPVTEWHNAFFFKSPPPLCVWQVLRKCCILNQMFIWFCLTCG